MEEILKQDKKINIIFLSLVQIDSLNDRGIYQDLLREFVNNWHNVTVVCPVERRTKLPTHIIYDEKATILQVRTLNIQKSSFFEKGFATITLNYFLKSAIKKYLSSKEYDLILYATPPITIASLIGWLKQKYSAKTYLLLKDIFPQNAVDMKLLRNGFFLHRYFMNKEKILYLLSDKIGCMSPANQSYILKHHPELEGKLEVNPNSLDLNRINIRNKGRNEVAKKFGFQADDVIFLYGGNLGKPQGIDFLIDIIKYSSLKNINAFFLIIGDGTEYNKLSTWFIINKPTNAKLIKHLPKYDFDEIAACCDVGMILLRKEFTIPNFPSRLLTYLENKMPVLAITDSVSDVGKIAEENNFGSWCHFGDLEAVKQKISLLSKDKNLRLELGNNGFDYMIKNYNVETSYNRIVKLFS